MRKIFALILLTIVAVTAGCGGGGGGSTPTTAVVKLSSQGTLPTGKAVAGFGATLELPAGVTAKITGGAVDATVVVSSGLLAGSAGTLGPVTYTPATATAKAKLDFTLASTTTAGVGVGEYATITLNLNSGSPTATDFNVPVFTPVDLSFANITGLTPKLTLSLL